jgi:alanine dehydrogenase
MPRIGVVREQKDGERRVALTPAAVAGLTTRNHPVVVETEAGDGAGYTDQAYQDAGATIADTATTWACDVVVKVKEPLPDEYRFFRPDLTIFCYLHLANEEALTRALMNAGTTAYAFETLVVNNTLPLLAPMSEIAGKAATLTAAHLLSANDGGRGQLIGGAGGAPPANVVVLGLGTAGFAAARTATQLGATVIGIDRNIDRLRDALHAGALTASQASTPPDIQQAISRADVVIGAALVAGGRAPILLTETMVASMGAGAVFIDIAIDQGGISETSRPTSLSEPTYRVHDVIHYCVTNIPGQFPLTATQALSAAIQPWVHAVVEHHPLLADSGALNVQNGTVVHPAVKQALGL